MNQCKKHLTFTFILVTWIQYIHEIIALRDAGVLMCV